MYRRKLLKVGGSLIVATGAVGTVSGKGDADPRAEPQGGTQPDEHVPSTHTGALGEETSKIPVGNWIVHDDGWVPKEEENKSREHMEEFANASTQKFIIDGETFELDSFDDWEYWEEDDGTPHLSWEYTTPPKKKGKEYTVRWEAEWDNGPIDGSKGALAYFPFENQVEIVKQ